MSCLLWVSCMSKVKKSGRILLQPPTSDPLHVSFIACLNHIKAPEGHKTPGRRPSSSDHENHARCLISTSFRPAALQQVPMLFLCTVVNGCVRVCVCVCVCVCGACALVCLLSIPRRRAGWTPLALSAVRGRPFGV